METMAMRNSMAARKWKPAALLGPALITLLMVSRGGQNPPDFGDPLPGITPDFQARFLAGQTSFSTVETVPEGVSTARCSRSLPTHTSSDLSQIKIQPRESVPPIDTAALAG
jgi:hypothetical protein